MSNRPTLEECKKAILNRGLESFAFRQCSICNCFLTIEFELAERIWANPKEFGYQPGDPVVGLNKGCGCSSFYSGIETQDHSWLQNWFEEHPDMWKEFSLVDKKIIQNQDVSSDPAS